MQTVGATVLDIGHHFLAHLGKLPPIVAAAFVQYDSQRNEITVSTLLDQEDEHAENELASIELSLERTFEDYPMDFETIHLRGRSPDLFIPPDAAVLFRRPAPRRADAK
ncbi:MAG: hypothetical protein FJ027_22400 [Candidatus Rokubacteria bacterium]|nr:hypothetical protein [Candidatus Rokubacteria bacterium]